MNGSAEEIHIGRITWAVGDLHKRVRFLERQNFILLLSVSLLGAGEILRMIGGAP